MMVDAAEESDDQGHHERLYSWLCKNNNDESNSAWAARRKMHNITRRTCDDCGPYSFEALYLKFPADKFPGLHMQLLTDEIKALASAQ